jgi:hypothetical protein
MIIKKILLYTKFIGQNLVTMLIASIPIELEIMDTTDAASSALNHDIDSEDWLSKETLIQKRWFQFSHL